VEPTQVSALRFTSKAPIDSRRFRWTNLAGMPVLGKLTVDDAGVAWRPRWWLDFWEPVQIAFGEITGVRKIRRFLSWAWVFETTRGRHVFAISRSQRFEEALTRAWPYLKVSSDA
jgi:hypothetical protein